MKNKKELRWLLLMVIPFMIMFGIHFITPLAVAISSQPFAAIAYIVHQLGTNQNQIRSTNVATAVTIQAIIRKYVRLTQIFNGFTLQQKNDSLLLQREISINSAYQFSNSIRNNSIPYSTLEGKSMWFTTNTTNSVNLSSNLKMVYDRYLQKQLFLRSSLQDLSSSTISAISLLFISQNQSIFFSYPTKYNEYHDIKSSAQGSFYPQALEVYNKSNFTSFAFVRQQSGNNFLIICKFTKINKNVMIPCIHLNIKLLVTQIMDSVNLIKSNPTKVFLISSNPVTETTNRTIPQVVLGIQNGADIIIANNSALNLTGTGVVYSNFSLNLSLQSEQLVIVRTRYFTSYISPINYYNNMSNTIIMRVVTQSQLQANLNLRAISIINSLKAMLIPNGILILIGSIVSAFVLKYLLDSLDNELSELDNRCKFIVDGDINVQISEHEGTEDIRQVYDQVRIINKIHRYSTSIYFTGHPAEKLLKYNQALQFLLTLNYDVGNVLENMGEVCTYLEYWTKAISSYNRSVVLGLRQIKERYNLSMDDVLRLKRQKKSLPQGYKQLELILIRRMFKLCYTYIKYIELRSLFAKADQAESANQQQKFQKTMEMMKQQSFQNLRLLKICYYPDYSNYSECIIFLLFEAQQLASMKRVEQANKMLEIVSNYNNIYAQKYPQMTQKLKGKGSKYKLLHKRNKLTPFSRLHPQVLNILKKLLQAKITAVSTESYDKYITITNLLTDAMKTGYIFESIGYIVAIWLRNLLTTLKIDPQKYQSTKVFIQAVPFKTLFYGQIINQVEPHLLKFPTTTIGLQRQFVLLIDCAKYNIKPDTQYFQQKANYVYNKLVKPQDRVSIIKFNVKTGIKIECNLILKESNEKILSKQIGSCFRQPNQVKGSLSHIVDVLHRTVNRIKSLQCQKIIVMFFKSIHYYSQVNKRKSKKKSDFLMEALNYQQQCQVEQMSDFGFHVFQALKTQDLRNCKLIIYCSKDDSIQKFRTYFGLSKINKQLWKNDMQRNNLVYIVEQRHKLDIDRILMVKPQEAPDNHIFIL